MQPLTIIGGGLAGSEAAWQAAQNDIAVTLYEMRPNKMTEAHISDQFAELVCSNSLGSNLPDRASGLLKEELRRLNSFVLKCAEETKLPAGGALAVDRIAFSKLVTQGILSHPNIKVIRDEAIAIPDTPTIIASGPLTSASLTRAIQVLTGESGLYFYDAIAPILTVESINMEIAFRASRFQVGDQEEGDYINCPFDKNNYENFVENLRTAQRVQLRDFEKDLPVGDPTGKGFFEGCLPVEIIAERGQDSLAFGPMRPIGIYDPQTHKRPHAVVQLRQENLAGSLYNMVGFQTNLTYPEQKRVFQMIPGLEHAEFVRYGQMHRNTFISSPKFLLSTLQFKTRPDLLFAGQITGVEGYMGNIATGWLAGINAARTLKAQPALIFPQSTMLGALCHYVAHAEIKDFQPMKANFGILSPLSEDSAATRRHKLGKREKAALYKERSISELENFLQEQQIG